MTFYAFIFVLLIIATVTTHALARRRSQERLENRRRVYTWWGISTFLMVVLEAPPLVFAGVFCAIAFISTREAGRLDRAGTGLGKAVGYALALATIVSYAAFGKTTVCQYAIPIGFAWLSYLTRRMPRLSSIFLLLYIGSSLGSFLIFSLGAHFSGQDMREVTGIVLFIVAVCDITQYILGKTYGRHQLAKVLSPRKTWEGAIAGVVTTTLLGATAGHLRGESVASWVVCGALLGLGAILGDLLISSFKRRAQISTTGQCLPGMGGILDRIDSLLLAGPCFALVFSLTN